MNLARDFDEFIGCLIAHGDSTPAQVADPRRMLQMGSEPVQIHVMSAISGVTWSQAWADRATGPCGRHEVAFLGRDTFPRNTRAAGRPQDLADIDALTEGEADSVGLLARPVRSRLGLLGHRRYRVRASLLG